jgi:hypothetical protein
MFLPTLAVMGESTTLFKMETIDEKQAVRFLLGDLSEESRLKLEERFFKDDRFYEQLLAIQEELADDYVQDKLSASERVQFEKHFLRSARRRERVEFAAAFSQALPGHESRAPAPPSSAPWWESLLAFVRPESTRMALGAAAVALVLLVGAAWLLVENRRLAGRVQQARAEKDSLIQRSGANEAEAERKREELERQINALRAQGGEMETKIQQKQRELEALQRARSPARLVPASGEIALFILPPGLTRGTDEPERLIIPAAARSIQLQLDLEREEDYQGYVAEIRTARGNLVWSKSGLALKRTSYGRAVFLTIPARLISNGEYEVALKGAVKAKLEAVGYYYFIALKQS